MPIFSENVNSLILDLEKSNGQFWNVPREVAQILYFFVRNAVPEKILEIGTSNGYSGLWLAQGLRHNFENCNKKGVLITVESHQDRFNLAGENFERAGLNDFIKQKKGHAPEIFTLDEDIKSGGFDLMFFDATKKQHVEFLIKAYPLLKKGGVVLADNVLSHYEEMKKFLDFAETIESLRGEVVSVGDGLFVGVKEGVK